MSAFVVSDETMHRVVKAFVHTKVFPNTVRDFNDLGRGLFTMNFSAMHHRYGELNDPSQYVFEDRAATPAEMWKACECFLYQCTEGDVPQTELYQLTQEVSNKLAVEMTGIADTNQAHERAWKLPEVERAPWDFYERSV